MLRFVLAVALLSACSANVYEDQPDAAVESSVDSSVVADSAPDSAVDSDDARDSAPEAHFDTGIDSDVAVDSTTEVAIDSEPVVDASMDAAPLPTETVVYVSSPSPAAACDSTVTKLSELVTTDACAAIVRFTYETDDNLGWQIRCDAPAAFTEASARMELAAYVAPLTTIERYKWMPTTPADPWLLHASPGDFGGVGFGAFRSGKLLFAGGIVWLGRGDIAYPKSFRPASELTMDCGPFGKASPRKFLPSGEMKDTSEVAVNRVLRSPLLYALHKKHSKLNAWVLGYPRTVGLLDPRVAEWIVMIESAK